MESQNKKRVAWCGKSMDRIKFINEGLKMVVASEITTFRNAEITTFRKCTTLTPSLHHKGLLEELALGAALVLGPSDIMCSFSIAVAEEFYPHWGKLRKLGL
jgi:hypothetical protein